MKKITYSDEAAPWSRSNHLMGTRLLSSSNDSDNNPGRTRSEIKVNQVSFNQSGDNELPDHLPAVSSDYLNTPVPGTV
jgi:hypothetical protein